MKGDYSRDTFDPLRNFTRVIMQQGRVQLDADFNEQASILLHYLQTLAADLIGPHGGPKANVGFRVEITPSSNNPNLIDDLHISAGRYYVDGLLCENYPQAEPPAPPAMFEREAARDYSSRSHAVAPMGVGGAGASAAPPDFISFFDQPNYPLRRDGFKFPEGPFLVLLDVWERLVTSLEVPAIREVALGGPDTAARAELIWQVRLFPLPQDVLKDINPRELTCQKLGPEDLENLRRLLEPGERAMLKARTKEPEDINATSPCTVSPDARYRGTENQLYRVEIHRGNADGSAIGDENNGPTFMWSRENGSVTFPVLDVDGAVVTLGHLGRDERFGLDVGDWVEFVNDDEALIRTTPQRPLYKVVSAPDVFSMQVTLSDAPNVVIDEADRHPLLRRWDHQEGTDPSAGGLQLGSDGGALVVEGSGETGWLELEDGIEVQFQPGATYRRGDYWLIPARTATGDIEWPRTNGEADALPPRGVEHHYAPLAIVYADATGGGHQANDLRRTWDYLAQCQTVCPAIRVDGPDVIIRGTTSSATYAAVLDGLTPDVTPAYNWTVSDGVIIASGQGTASINVSLGQFTGNAVTATVQVSGLPQGCPDTASRTTPIALRRLAAEEGAEEAAPEQPAAASKKRPGGRRTGSKGGSGAGD